MIAAAVMAAEAAVPAVDLSKQMCQIKKPCWALGQLGAWLIQGTKLTLEVLLGMWRKNGGNGCLDWEAA